MVQRTAPTAPAKLVFTTQELGLLDSLVRKPYTPANGDSEISTYVFKLACLGGYLARSHDPPPGNMVIWRGLSRLTEEL